MKHPVKHLRPEERRQAGGARGRDSSPIGKSSERLPKQVALGQDNGAKRRREPEEETRESAGTERMAGVKTLLHKHRSLPQRLPNTAGPQTTGFPSTSFHCNADGGGAGPCLSAWCFQPQRVWVGMSAPCDGRAASLRGVPPCTPSCCFPERLGHLRS